MELQPSSSCFLYSAPSGRNPARPQTLPVPYEGKPYVAQDTVCSKYYSVNGLFIVHYNIMVVTVTVLCSFFF